MDDKQDKREMQFKKLLALFEKSLEFSEDYHIVEFPKLGYMSIIGKYLPGKESDAVIQCQLVKNFENRINSLNIGIKYHSEMNPGANGVDHAICRTVLLFDCMVKKQVCKMPAM